MLTTQIPDLPATLQKLVQHISDNDLDAAEIQAVSDIALEVLHDPSAVLKRLYSNEIAQLASPEAALNLNLVLAIELEDWFISADHVDEVWEDIVAAFEASTLPPFPYEHMPFSTVDEFYQWASAQLATHYPHYALMELGQSHQHDFQVLLVKRDALTEVIQLAEHLQLHAVVLNQ